MIYLYDNAIVKDLEKSFNPDNVVDPVVKVISPDQVFGVIAQLKEDRISLPLVVLERQNPITIDDERMNFTRLHKGVPSVFDKDKNNYWNEKAIPIKLSYDLSVLASNQTDLDEVVREIMFKYTSMYFLSIVVPYESKREISFGVSIDYSSGINQKSGAADYLDSGKLYQSSIVLNCEGCVQLHYTPIHMKRSVIELDVE